MANYPAIILKKGKGQSVRRFHPWIFSGAIGRKEAGLENGQLVNVFSDKNEFLGTGFYNDGSISVKILSFRQEDINNSFWKSRIENAFLLRKNLGIANSPDTNVYRLINGEGDGLPGLIIDFYDGLLVIQPHHTGYNPFMNEITGILQEIYAHVIKAVYLKNEQKKGELPDRQNDFLFGKTESVVVKENGILFSIDWKSGQKTGFFIDQRENRALLKAFSKGRDVLNVFSYTGGFSLYAVKGEARHVDEVESSQKALELSSKNKILNEIDQSLINSINADAMEYLSQIDGKYDLIILDPPAFAKHLSSRNNAIRAYTRINEMALRQIKKGGILFTFSCSQVVTRPYFESAVFSASINSGRNTRILYRLDQPGDHPVSAFHPEGEYLKGLVLYVE